MTNEEGMRSTRRRVDRARRAADGAGCSRCRAVRVCAPRAVRRPPHGLLRVVAGSRRGEVSRPNRADALALVHRSRSGTTLRAAGASEAHPRYARRRFRAGCRTPAPIVEKHSVALISTSDGMQSLDAMDRAAIDPAGRRSICRSSASGTRWCFACWTEFAQSSVAGRPDRRNTRDERGVARLV